MLPDQVLASIGQLEFFYDQAPDVMRSCSMALQLLSVCIGSYLSGAVVLAVSYFSDLAGHDWLPSDLNYGRLDLFFFLLAGACIRQCMQIILRTLETLLPRSRDTCNFSTHPLNHFSFVVGIAWCPHGLARRAYPACRMVAPVHWPRTLWGACRIQGACRTLN